MLHKFFLVIFMVVLCGGGTLLADEGEDDQKKSGFFGMVTLGGYYTSGESSQLDVDDENKRIESLTKNDKRTSEVGPGFLGNLGYRFAGTGTEISLGSTIENGGALTLEVAQSFEKVGLMKASVQAGRGKTWKDPYVTGRDREETDEDFYGFGYKWENIFRTGGQLELRGRTIDVKEDLIGSREPDLSRDGHVYSVEAGYEFKLNESSRLTPFIGGFSADASDDIHEDSSRITITKKGGANEYDGFSVGLKHVWATEKFMLESKLSYARSEYEKRHPLFDRTREDDLYGFLSTLTWMNPLGFKNYHVILAAGYNRTESNIGFFEGSRYITLLGVGYQF